MKNGKILILIFLNNGNLKFPHVSKALQVGNHTKALKLVLIVKNGLLLTGLRFLAMCAKILEKCRLCWIMGTGLIHMDLMHYLAVYGAMMGIFSVLVKPVHFGLLLSLETVIHGVNLLYQKVNLAHRNMKSGFPTVCRFVASGIKGGAWGELGP